MAGSLNSGLSYLITTVELYTNFILTLSGKVPSPICGQTVILAEKCEENTYTLIEPSIDQQNISPVKNGKKQPKDIETRGTSILGEVRNVKISRATQQLLNGKSNYFLAFFALANSKINQIVKFLDDNLRNYLNFLFKP